MTLEPTARRVDTARLAAAARSILSCPQDVELVVDGVDDVTAGLEAGPDGESAGLTLQDAEGRPVFSCPPGSALAVAADEGRGALLTLSSGLGRAGSPARAATLTLTGRLEATGLERCDCCAEIRVTVRMQLDYVALARAAGHPGDPEAPLRVPLSAFTAPEHRINRGFLQRSAEHANRCHQAELRRAVAATAGTPLAQVLGVHLVGLSPDRVEVQWVDVHGGHTRTLVFERPATTPSELGELLRRELHAGLC